MQLVQLLLTEYTKVLSKKEQLEPHASKSIEHLDSHNMNMLCILISICLQRSLLLTAEYQKKSYAVGHHNGSPCLYRQPRIAALTAAFADLC